MTRRLIRHQENRVTGVIRRALWGSWKLGNFQMSSTVFETLAGLAMHNSQGVDALKTRVLNNINNKVKTYGYFRS